MKEPTDEELNAAICEWTGAQKNYITGPEALGNIHEAIMTLNDNMRDLVNDNLVEDTCTRLQSLELNDLDAAINATARQRAVALLRVVKPEMFQ